MLRKYLHGVSLSLQDSRTTIGRIEQKPGADGLSHIGYVHGYSPGEEDHSFEKHVYTAPFRIDTFGNVFKKKQPRWAPAPAQSPELSRLAKPIFRLSKTQRYNCGCDVTFKRSDK